MVTFAPYGQDQRPEDFTRVSQGYRDTSIGEFLKDAGDTLSTGVKVVDDVYKKLVRDEARAISDDVQNATIDELQLHAGVGTPKMRADRTPDEVARFVERARRFQSGVNAGNVKESSYWAMLDTGARQLRSRYPGYRDTIDDAFKEFTGQVPANALIRELRQDAEALAAKTKDPEQLRIKQILEMAQRGELTGSQAQQAFANPIEWSLPRLASVQADWNKVTADTQRATSQLALGTAQGTANRKMIDETGRTVWQAEYKKFIQSTDSIYAKSVAERQKIVDATVGRDPTPEEARRAGELTETAIAQVNQIWDNFLLTPRPELGGRTYGIEMSKEERESMKLIIDDINKDARLAITDPKSGFMNKAARSVEIATSSAEANLLARGNLAYMAAARKLVGEQVLNSVLLAGDQSNSAVSLKAIHRTMVDAASIKLADKDQPAPFQKLVSDAKVQGAPKEAIEAMVRTAVGSISDPNMPVDASRQMLVKMYGPGNAGFLEATSGKGRDAQLAALNEMANPKVARALSKRAKETGDPAFFDMYQRWVTDQVFALNAVDVGTVAKAQMDAPGVKITFSPDTFAFNVSEQELPSTVRPGEAPGMVALRGVDNWWQRSRTPELNKAVQDLNKALAPLRDIAEHHSADKKEFAYGVLQTFGARITSTATESGMDTFLTKMAKVLYNQEFNPTRFVAPGPYKKSETPAPSEPIDITPTFATEGLKRLGELDAWFRSKLPTRESVDKARNQTRNTPQAPRVD